MAQSTGIDHAAFKAFERDGYSRVASNYGDETARVTAQVNEPILDAVGAKAGTRLLDVACGPGRLSAAAAKRGSMVTGIDFSEPMVALARQGCPAGKFHVGDAERLPFEAEQFDVVVCSLGLLHFPNPEQAIAEVKRVLVRGGMYAFTCWTPPARNPFMGLILGSVQKHGTLDLPLPPGPPLFRFGEPAECERTLREAGMEVVETTELAMNWDFESPDHVVPGVLASTARLAPMLALQTAEQRQRIEQAITEGARVYVTGKRVAIPAPMTLAVARKP
jgi:SAM-dependent methyltransferase